MTAPKELGLAASGEAAQAQGSAEHGLPTHDHPSETPATSLEKRFATARARLALGGFTLHILDGGASGPLYFVQRWDRSRTLADMDAVEAFITQALGKQ